MIELKDDCFIVEGRVVPMAEAAIHYSPKPRLGQGVAIRPRQCVLAPANAKMRLPFKIILNDMPWFISAAEDPLSVLYEILRYLHRRFDVRIDGMCPQDGGGGRHATRCAVL